MNPARASASPVFACSSLLRTMVTVVAVRGAAPPGEWSRFRGPNGSGVSEAANVPIAFGPADKLVWRLALPRGHSSPIIWGDRIYLTAFRDQALMTIAIDRSTGRILWERPAPGAATKSVDARNNPASPSPAVEANGVYVFFPDYGLVAYESDGRERWKMPLGPFNNIYGMGASPVIVGNDIVLACDQSTGLVRHGRRQAIGRASLEDASGRRRRAVTRRRSSGARRTAAIEILLPGSFLLTAYDAATGAKRWWVRGLSFEIKSTPVVAGDTIFINGYGAPQNDPGRKVVVPPASGSLEDGRRRRQRRAVEGRVPQGRSQLVFDGGPRRQPGRSSQDEWEYYRAALDSENGMLAIRLGGTGDTTETAVKWKYQRSVPQLPSPLILSRRALHGERRRHRDDAEPGDRRPHQRRAGSQGALGNYYASPVAASGHIFFVSERGAVADPAAHRRPHAGRGQRSERGHLRHAGVCRRPDLHPDRRGALRVRDSRRRHEALRHEAHEALRQAARA